MKRELSWKANLLIYQSLYVLTLSHGHELLVITERITRGFLCTSHLSETLRLTQSTPEGYNLAWESLRIAQGELRNVDVQRDVLGSDKLQEKDDGYVEIASRLCDTN